MRSDPRKTADVRAWLERASEDLRSAEILLGAESAQPAPAVFHCQQTAEKAYKAFLAWHDVPFRKTHELEELGRACCALDGSLGEIARRAMELTPYAWRFRYPGDATAPSEQETETAFMLAREVYDAILSRLPGVARP